MQTPIYNSSGKCKCILIESHDRITISTPSLKLLGWYIKASDKTFDASGRLIGTSNLLSMLLQD